MVRLEAHRHDPDFAGIGGLVSAALASVGGGFADIGCIAVDVGPGNLTSVRAAVAYANGLAFSLGVMVYPVMSLELMAAQVGHDRPGPVLCLRKGDGGDAYAGLFGCGEPDLRYGQLRDVLPALAGGLGEVTVAGAHRELAAGLLPQARVHDSGVDSPDVRTLYQMLTARADDTRLVPTASAVNEGSREFHGRTAVHT